MAGATVDHGHTTAIAFGTSSWTAEITSLDWSGVSREAIDTSHLSTAAAGAGKFGNRTFVFSELVDPGQITIEGHFDTIQTATTKQPPIELAAETITVTWPQSGGTSAATFAASGGCIDYSISVPEDGKITFSATFQMSGNVTVTAAA